MEFIGKPAINPILFYSGKITGYIIWILLLFSILGTDVLNRHEVFHNDYIAIGLLLAGAAVSAVSMFYLGRSTRFGLPTSKTNLKTTGIYRISRNPMYLGFDLVTLASVIWFLQPVVILSGLYCLIIYHIIITREEGFLEKIFGSAYLEYKKKVRRYI